VSGVRRAADRHPEVAALVGDGHMWANGADLTSTASRNSRKRPSAGVTTPLLTAKARPDHVQRGFQSRDEVHEYYEQRVRQRLLSGEKPPSGTLVTGNQQAAVLHGGTE
jgi:hypothetical protein